jgi:hypothetical protein
MPPETSKARSEIGRIRSTSGISSTARYGVSAHSRTKMAWLAL